MTLFSLPICFPLWRCPGLGLSARAGPSLLVGKAHPSLPSPVVYLQTSALRRPSSASRGEVQVSGGVRGIPSWVARGQPLSRLDASQPQAASGDRGEKGGRPELAG